MFFFFKQKTAYEMRISDWGSDVCSSDLDPDDYQPRRRQRHRNRHPASAKRRRIGARPVKKAHVPLLAIIAAALLPAGCAVNNGASWSEARPVRSEEHTSELQSLMRISYAVFCLKKKNNTIRNHYKRLLSHQQ